MKLKLLILFSAMILLLTSASGQVTSSAIEDFLNKGNKSAQNAFANVEAYLAQNKSNFDNSEEVIKLFNQERVRLGDSFETEVMKYPGSDINKYYWIIYFVEVAEYLQGNKPLPELADKIREKAIDVPVADDNVEQLGMKFTLMRKFAVDKYKAGNLTLAFKTKRNADVIYQKVKDFGVIGADTEYVICVYENLEKNPKTCQENKTHSTVSNTSKTNLEISSEIYNGGVLNGKATFLAKPEYPKDALKAKATGSVTVEIMVDENGNVISAKAISGHQLLRQNSENAALGTKFDPLVINGIRRKVKGILVYNFN